MNMIPTDSAAIHSYGYDPNTNTLVVKFHHGGVYHYAGVSQAEYEHFHASPSKGSHIHKHIKSKHEGVKQ